MWKRIQNLYIVIATILTIAMYFINFMTFTTDGAGEKIYMYEKTVYLIILISLTAASLCSIWAYKVPLLQARVCTISTLIFLGFQILIAIDFFEYKEYATFSIIAIFPICAAILNALAARSALVDGVTISAIKSIKKRKGKKKL